MTYATPSSHRSRRLRTALTGAAAVLLLTVAGALTQPAAAEIVTVPGTDMSTSFLRPRLDPVPPAQYAVPDPTKNGPEVGAYQDPGLRDALEELIEAAVPGSTVYGSLYTFSDQGIVDSLLAANGRGVTVRLLVEMCTGGNPASCDAGAEVGALVTALGTATSGPGSWVHRCYASCAGGGEGINHSKFWVFSELDDGRGDVVVIGSANPTRPQQQMWQNKVTVVGNVALADGFRDYVGRLLSAGGSTKTYETGHIDAGNTRVWLSPRNTSSAGEASTIAASFSPVSARTDVVAAAIDDIACSPTSTDDVVRVAMWGMRSHRPEVIDALGDKKDQGCTVEVAGGEHQDMLPLLADRGIPVYAMNPGGCRQSWFTVGSGANSECSDGSIHSKYFLVQGTSRKTGTFVRHVFTGSQNWTNGALVKNDEVLVRIDDPATYDGFVADFDAIKQAAITIAPTNYPDATHSTANAVAAGDQLEPEAASYVDSTGRHVNYVVFSSGSRTGLGNEIRLARFIDGVRDWENVVRTGGDPGWNYKQPDVDVSPDGTAVVVWADDRDGNGGYELRARSVTAAGVMGSIVSVNSASNGDQVHPSIGVLPDGRFAIAWEDITTTGVSSIRYAAFSAAGARLTPVTGGYDVPVQAVAGGTYLRPDLDLSGDGTAVVAWEDDEDGNGGFSIRAKAGTFAGVFGSTIAVHTGSLSDGQQRMPRTAIADNGTWYVVWEDQHTGRTGQDGQPQSAIYVRGYSGSTALFAARTVTSPIYRWTNSAAGYAVTAQTLYQSDRVGRQAHPDVSTDGNGGAVVVWHESPQSTGLTRYQSGTEVWGAGITAAGTIANTFPESRLSVFTAYAQQEPTVGVDSAGYFAVVYVDDWDGNGGTQLHLRTGLRNCAQTC
ncbi:MAG: putative secreted protein [Mycobacterium sp.]|nr:putative secreted protein [Mycobacterium sp.]